ncbi:hypothetical protein QF117_09440 [Vibrio sp. YMD68]|uniref:hypothetical protein n=1 Tax=Vibrio sp. YMD68 TaxID=3042300 RepID=UPI00249B0358|nr:hypothetical protein [Vibrio sp. YMD68]WGW01023.1 hypothetical protein QF117_09440 [Vibrio sp. YMD68]
MCSVSWLVDEHGYQIFFNRDEQKSRALALPPRQITVDGTDVIMPIDPVGSGSWISLNEFGLSLCLLNNYQGPANHSQGLVNNDQGSVNNEQGVMPSAINEKKETLMSRGLLLKHLSSYSEVEKVEQAFRQWDLHRFAPFTLLAFSPSLKTDNPYVTALEWDGQKRLIHLTDCPLFSSSVDLEAVTAYRLEQFSKLTAKDKSVQTLLEFHTHHHPEHLHRSTCMHREDAQTVSFTYLNVSKNRQYMSYVAGSPCDQLSEQTLKQHQYDLRLNRRLAS